MGERTLPITAPITLNCINPKFLHYIKHDEVFNANQSSFSRAPADVWISEQLHREDLTDI